MKVRKTQQKLRSTDTLYTNARVASIQRGIGLSRNDRKLLRLKDLHKGKVGYLIGNGPSVRTEDLEALDGAVTFCCNRFHLCYDMTDFRQTYTVSSDQTMIDDFGEEIVSKSAGTVVLVSNERTTLRGDYILLRWDDRSREPFRFSEQPYHHVWLGGSTLFSAAQLGYYMGIRHFYVYGVDHSFKHVIDDNEEDPFRRAKGDENHFIPNYRSGKGWNPQQSDHVELSFQTCDLFLRSRGGWMKNATRGGKLEVLERVNLGDLDLGSSSVPVAKRASGFRNGDFEQWDGEKVPGWDSVGCVTRRCSVRHLGAPVLEMVSAEPDAKGHPHLHQRVEVDTTAQGGRLGIFVYGRSWEKGTLFAKLDVAANGERDTITLSHPGDGRWYPLNIEVDLTSDTDLDTLHYSIGLRKEATKSAQISMAQFGTRPGP